MGLLDSLSGNATEVDPQKLQKEMAPVLAPGETIAQAFAVFRDMFIFTDKRLVLVDKQGLTGKKATYHSIPYKSVSQFSVETAGTFDRDSELTIWVRGSQPIKKELKKGTDIVGVQRTLAKYVLG